MWKVEITYHQGNSNQNHIRYDLTTVRLTITNKIRAKKHWQGEKEQLCSAGGNANWCSLYGKECGGSSENEK